MQVTETNSEGLKRQLKIVVGAADLSARYEKRVDDVKGRVNIKGFRPGKVPASYIKKVYGRSLMGEVVQEAVTESSRKALEERAERAAFTPNIKIGADEAEATALFARVIEGGADLAYDMEFEVIPTFELADLTALAIERPVAEPGDEDVAENIKRIANSSREFDVVEAREATTGDRVTIDFVGSIDGVEFDGGRGDDAPVVIGQGGFIPGFEDGLIGAKAGDDRVVEAKFPDAYPMENLKGKAAAFAIKVKEVATAKDQTIDDDYAKKIGFESLDKLKEFLRSRLQDELSQLSRTRAKRQVLDRLDSAHSFDLPPTLVDNEFKEIWGQLMRSLEQAKKTFADEGKTEDGERAEYRKLAERRVRLGLVLAEIGEKNGVKVDDAELAQALQAQVRQYPGQEKEIYKLYRENPSLLVHLRAPIFEEKVVDYVLGKVQIADQKMTPKELMTLAQADNDELEGDLTRAGQSGEDEDQDHSGHDHSAHDHDHDHHGHDHSHDHDHHGHDHSHDHDHKKD